MPEVALLDIEVPRSEVLRYMGYPRQRPPSPAVVRRLDELWPIAVSLLHARGAFVLVDKASADAVGVPSPSERVALCACTIGDELEQHDALLGQQGDALGALIVDAFGSAAAEAAAELLHARVCAAVQTEQLGADRRISPGYGTWNVNRQPDLFAHLPMDQLGIRLTEGCMMVPRKSVSFAVVLTTQPQASPKARCSQCDRVDCNYRVREDDPSAAAQETIER